MNRSSSSPDSASALSDHRAISTATVFFAYLAAIALYRPSFFSGTNLSSLLYYACLLAPAVLGAQMLMVLGLFDLSAGAVAAVSGVVAAQAMISGYTIPLAILIALVCGLAFGLVNWLLVSRLRLPALIGTLITAGVAKAVALGISNGVVVGGLPLQLDVLALGGTPIRYAVMFGVLLCMLAEVASRYHVVFRRMYQTGDNREAAEMSGINVKCLELTGFLLASGGAAMVGILQISRTLSASPTIFNDLALEVIAACVIGGTSVRGGKGWPIGAFLGMMVIVASRNLAVQSGVDIFWRDLAIALVVLASALLTRDDKKLL
ncbi:MAG TPA: ABC transporter permease [Verrucomicrobiales bacterium]|nr:ABC transporter permease [Verrucomicrobiales bacterium]